MQCTGSMAKREHGQKKAWTSTMVSAWVFLALASTAAGMPSAQDDVESLITSDCDHTTANTEHLRSAHYKAAMRAQSPLVTQKHARSAADDLAAVIDITCGCDGAVAGPTLDHLTCYGTLDAAIQSFGDAGFVFIGGSKIIKAPIYFSAPNISLQGVPCNGQKAQIIASMDEPTGAILMADGPENSLTIKDIDFSRDPTSGHASAIRTSEGGLASTSGRMALTLSDCSFNNFMTKAIAGSVIYINVATKVNIGNDCVFAYNIVDRKGDWDHADNWKYGGGGALYIGQVWSASDVTIRGQWKMNSNLFQHGLGGAIKLDWIEGNVLIDGRFTGNQASDGAAVNIDSITPTGNVRVQGNFVENHAIDYGLGARGGAVRPQYISGTLRLGGTYVRNRSDGRGGVFATNRLQSGGSMYIGGTYQDNSAGANGGVLSITSDATGLTKILPTAKFSGNTAGTKEGSASTSLLFIHPSHTGLAEDEWDGDFEFHADPSTTVIGNASD